MKTQLSNQQPYIQDHPHSPCRALQTQATSLTNLFHLDYHSRVPLLTKEIRQSRALVLEAVAAISGRTLEFSRRLTFVKTSHVNACRDYITKSTCPDICSQLLIRGTQQIPNTRLNRGEERRGIDAKTYPPSPSLRGKGRVCLQDFFPCAARCSSHSFSDRWLSPEGFPSAKLSTLISSSKSVQ